MKDCSRDSLDAIYANARLELMAEDIVGPFKDELVRSGDCPWCEREGMFSVHRDLQTYACFGCGETGGVVQFAMKRYDQDFIGAIGGIRGGVWPGTGTMNRESVGVEA